MADNPWYGRKYQIIVSDASGNALDVSGLHCTFNIERVANQKSNFAEITIFNLNESTEHTAIEEGKIVIVNAGYENGVYGKIFEGEVFQPMWDRENGIDYKLTLNCIDGDSFLNGNFVKGTMTSGYNYKQLIEAMASSARKKIPMGAVSSTLKTQKSARGMTIFGDPRDTFRNIARDNNAAFFSNNNTMHFTKITDVPKGEALVVSPESGLIGTPTQTDNGFSFKCLLNPNIQAINGENTQMMVKIENSTIRQQKVTFGQKTSMLDQDMIGKVIGVTYVGDTRGQDWYCDVTCVAKGGKIPLQLLN